MLDEIRPYIKSITADNGKEFAGHQYITDEYCDSFLLIHIVLGKEVQMKI
jgi:IS30 family transposase